MRMLKQMVLLVLVLVVGIAALLCTVQVATAAPTITFTIVPGVTFKPWTVVPLKWKYTGDIGPTVNIVIVSALNSSVQSFQSPAGSGGTGQYNWTPPLSPMGQQYIITIASAQNPQISAKTVETVAQASVSISNPTSGVILKPGTQVPIVWTCSGPCKGMRVRAIPVKSGSPELNVIAPANMGQGRYDGWTTPNSTNDVQYVIKVEDPNNNKIFGTSVVTVQAKPLPATIILLHPNTQSTAHNQKAYGMNYWEAMYNVTHKIALVTNTSNYPLLLWFQNTNGDVSKEVNLGPHQSITDFNYLQTPTLIWWEAAGPVYNSNVFVTLRIDFVQ